MFKKKNQQPYSKYHLPLLLRGVEGPEATTPEMSVIRKITARLSDGLCILFLVIITCAADQPWVSGATEAGISRQDAEIGGCLWASLWLMTNSLAALGASCVLRLQKSSWGSVLDPSERVQKLDLQIQQASPGPSIPLEEREETGRARNTHTRTLLPFLFHFLSLCLALIHY